MPKLVLLWTDLSVFLVLTFLLAYVLRLRARPELRAGWRRVFASGTALGSALLLGVALLLTLLDSVHFRRALPVRSGASAAYDTHTESLLDLALSQLIESRESSYSAPLATHGFVKDSRIVGGQTQRVFPRLEHGGAGLSDPASERTRDLSLRISLGLLGGLLGAALCFVVAASWRAKRYRESAAESLRMLLRDRTELPWRAALATFGALLVLALVTLSLARGYHVLGTDRTGNDVLYLALKSVRTAVVIGSLTELATVPFAVLLGVAAGYYRGWVDSAIEYVYTLLASVPSILLIAAGMLMVQVSLDLDEGGFETSAERADLKLLLLCIILGFTGWAGPCRLVRAETLKLRELEYVQAATALGVQPWRMMVRHIMPNVLHLVLITSVLDFSGLILYEAVLSYVGIGVDPSMHSFGGMINLARSELSRDPVVWWTFASAFVFMLALVLAANLFADAVRAAFDPKGHGLLAARKSAQARPPARTGA